MILEILFPLVRPGLEKLSRRHQYMLAKWVELHYAMGL